MKKTTLLSEQIHHMKCHPFINSTLKRDVVKKQHTSCADGILTHVV